MASYSRVKPPQTTHDNNDDLYSRPSIQNSPDWPSVELRSLGPSVRTLNQSDGGTYRGDLSSLANFSSNGLDPSVRSSVSTANMSTSPLDCHRRPSATSGSSHQKYRHLSLDKSEQSGRRRGGGPTQSSYSTRADKSSHQAELPPSRSRPSHRKSTLQSGTPAPPLLTPGGQAPHDSVNRSNSNQPVDVPISWTGAGKEDGHSRRRSRSRDPRDYVLPSGWISAPTGVQEFKAHGDHTKLNGSHRHKYSMTPLSQSEEQEVLVYPTVPPARSHRAPLIVEIPRAETHGAKAPDRLPVPAPTHPTPGKRYHNPAQMPAEGPVIIVPPVMAGAPLHASSSPPQQSFQSKQSFPPRSHQRPPPSQPYLIGSHEGPAINTIDDHKSSTNYNSAPTSPAAKPIVVIDATEAKRKASSGGAPQSTLRKFSSRRDSPGKSLDNKKKLYIAQWRQQVPVPVQVARTRRYKYK